MLRPEIYLTDLARVVTIVADRVETVTTGTAMQTADRAAIVLTTGKVAVDLVELRHARATRIANAMVRVVLTVVVRAALIVTVAARVALTAADRAASIVDLEWADREALEAQDLEWVAELV